MVYANPDQVLFFAVKRNRNYSEAYAKNPEKYENVIRTWTKTYRGLYNTVRVIFCSGAL